MIGSRACLTIATALATALPTALAARAAAAQSTAAPARAPRFVGRLIGVYDERTGEPLDSVEVRDMVSGSSALTTSTGTLSLFFVDTAGSLMRLRKIGYQPLTLFISNQPGESALTLTLEPVGQLLEKVVVTDTANRRISPRLRGFEERRRTGMGSFITEAELRKEDGRPLANVLRSKIPSVSVVDVVLPGGRRVTQVISRRMQGCLADIFLDGMKITTTGSGALSGRGSASRRENDISEFQIESFAAVEYHNVADLPAEFAGTGSGCGALFLWTRER